MPSFPPDSAHRSQTGDRIGANARDLSRRSILWAGGLGLLAVGAVACDTTRNEITPPPSPTPDEGARSRAADQEQRLAELAQRTSVAHPTLTWAAVASQAHTAHAEALRETLPPSRSPSTDAPSPGSSPGGSPPTVLGGPSAAARALAAAQLNASRDHRRALVDAGISGGVARLLASVAASDAAFSSALRDQAASA